MTTQTPAELLKCCPIDNTFKIIGKKFTIHIIRNMAMQRQTRFNQFLDSIEDTNPKTLSARLKEMEKAGLITRTVHAETPIRIEYTLTKKGEDLQEHFPFLETLDATESVSGEGSGRNPKGAGRKGQDFLSYLKAFLLAPVLRVEQNSVAIAAAIAGNPAFYVACGFTIPLAARMLRDFDQIMCTHDLWDVVHRLTYAILRTVLNCLKPSNTGKRVLFASQV